ncbi:MAG: transglutaminase domain-containing protein [Chloroflexota bacterium]
MAEHFTVRAFNRVEPHIGWLPFALLLAALVLVISAVLEVEWVPEDNIVIPLAFMGFLAAVWLAQSRTTTWVAWLFLVVLGAVLAIFLLAKLWPPLDILRQGNPAVANYWEQNVALFSDRIIGWYRSAARGGRSTETAAFAFGLAFGAWLLGAFLAWSAIRMRQPVWGLVALGVGLALTTYFGRAGLYWIIAFVGIVATTLALTQYGNLETSWIKGGTDYSGEVRFELLLYAGAVSLVLMSIAYALPAINVRAIAQTFRRQSAVSNAEDTLSRVFAGVQQPLQIPEEVAVGGATGILPRAFLLGGAPELLETVVLTATVATPSNLPSPLPGYHWRSVSYDIYTSRGWMLSPEREERFAADETLPLPDDIAETAVRTATISQDIQLAEEFRTTRYSLGQLLSTNRASLAYWRGADDLVRVRDEAAEVTGYHALSWIMLPTQEQLRRATLADVPPTILARYTDLPDTVPDRVRDLAEQIVASDPNSGNGLPKSPYDQALAIESFLRQYPYSLSVGLPPPDEDMVDYFLFNLQTGFCDYYASAMVVLARSLGLPARLAIGFLPQPANENGEQVIRQVDSHSWAEVYFGGIGWVEFEPTAPIPEQEATMAAGGQADDESDALPMITAPMDIPEPDIDRSIPVPLLFAFVAVTALVGVWWGRRWLESYRMRPRDLETVEAAYLSLETQSLRLGYLSSPDQTPQEFVTGFAGWLDDHDSEHTVVQEISPRLYRLAELYDLWRYGTGSSEPFTPEASLEATTLWESVRRDLARLASSRQPLHRLLGRWMND